MIRSVGYDSVQEPNDYRVFKDVSARDLGYDSSQVQTSVYDYISKEKQRIGLAVSTPVDGFESTIIMPQSHDYRNEPLAIRRSQIMATQLGARVALVETPGTVGLIRPDTDNPSGYSIYDDDAALTGAAPTLRQLRGALIGDFSAHSEAQLDAAVDTLGITSQDRLMLFGESMGAVTSVDMLRSIGERGLTLDAIMLHEVVNVSHPHGWQRLFSLLNNLGGIENDRRNMYFLENNEIGHPIQAFELVSDEQKRLDRARKSMAQQGVASLVDGLGMRAGIDRRLMENIARFGNKPPVVHIGRASSSSVSHQAEYSAFANELDNRFGTGLTFGSWEYVDTGEMPLGHSMLVSLGRQATHAQRLREFLEKTIS